MVISLDEARNVGLFYKEQFETAKRTIECWNMFDAEIWYGRVGLFRKIWNSTKNIFKKLICCTREKSQVDHRIRYIFAELQSGKSGLALLLCVYNYMWSKKNGLEAVNIIGSCSALARIPQQFKNDLEKIAKALDCHPDNIVLEKNIVGNSSWGKTDSVNIDDTEGKSVLLIKDETHMASAKNNQFYTHREKSYEAKKENPDKYPNFHILGISATPYDPLCRIQKDLKREQKSIYSLDVMPSGAGHLNPEGLRTNGRLPYYGEKKYSTWDNVPSNQIEAFRYELRKAKDYQKCGKFIFILRCDNDKLKEYKKEFPQIKFMSYMSDTSPVDTYPVDQLIPDMEKLQNDGQLYCLRFYQSYTEGCRIETEANSKLIAVFDSEKTENDPTIIQHIGRWCGYNKLHYDFPIYTHNNGNAIANHIEAMKQLQDCPSNQLEECLKNNVNIKAKTKNIINKRDNFRQVIIYRKGEDVLYPELFEHINGMKLSEDNRLKIEELRGSKRPLSDKKFFEPDCPNHNLSARRNGNGFQEPQLLKNLFQCNGKTYTKDIVNAESLGGMQYEVDFDKREIYISGWRENVQTVKKEYNNVDLTAQPNTKDSNETQRYIKNIFSTKNLIETKISHGKGYRNKIIIEDSFLLAERFVDGIKYGKMTVGRTKGPKITQKLVRFEKDDKHGYNKRCESKIIKFIEDNQSKTRIELIIEVAILIEEMYIETAEDMTKYLLENHPYLLTEKLVLVKDFTADFGKDLNEKSIFS
jgi:hypothetical protein